MAKTSRGRKTIYTVIISCFLTVASTLSANAQAGTLDTTFGSGGKVITDLGSNFDLIKSVALQQDGKIVVAGSFYSGDDDFAVARYNSNGSLDSTFGSAGIVITPFSTSQNDGGYSVAIQIDGKIVVAGDFYNGADGDFALIRYLSNGSLDSSFSFDGKVATNFNFTGDGGKAMAIQFDDKIVVAGVSDGDFALARYNTDGSPDFTFNTTGEVVIPIGNGTDIANAVAIQFDGKIVAAGYSFNGTDKDFAAVRLNTDGTPDNTFGTGGIVTTGFGGTSNDEATSVAIQYNDAVVLGGYSFDGINGDFAMLQYDANGVLDNTFGIGGQVATSVGTYISGSYGIAMQNNKIVLAGSCIVADDDFGLVRYNHNGIVDSTFGINGRVSTDFAGTDDYGQAVMFQSDGKIVVAGFSGNNVGSMNNFAIARYNGECFPSYFSQNPVICTGQSVTVGSNTYTMTGTYSDTLVSATGCDSVITTTLTVNPTYTITVDTTIYNGDSITVGTHTYTVAGSYIDTLIATNGCDSTVTLNLMVYTAINEFIGEEIQLKISPNPFTDELLIKGTLEKEVMLVFDIRGKEVIRQETFDGETIIKTDVLMKGIYFLNYNTPDKSLNIKLVKL